MKHAKWLLCSFALAGSTLFADTRISVGIGFGHPGYWYYPPPPPVGVYYVPAPQVIYVPAYPGHGYSWVEGYWYRSGPRYRWRDGYWGRPAHGVKYRKWKKPHHWQERGRWDNRDFRDRSRRRR
jgi:hypothetical protein